MSLTAAAMRLLAEKGLSMEDVIAVAAANEAERLPDAAERKRIRDRDRQRQRRQMSDNERQTGDIGDTAKSRSSEATIGDKQATNPPLAHVRDKPLPTEISGLAAVAETRERARDDWPSGSANEHLRALVEIANTSRLDPNRSPGLVTTVGRLAAWRRDGASWDHDVVPTVTTLTRKTGPPIATWKFFDSAIAQSIAANRQALEIPSVVNFHERASPRDRRATAFAERLSDIDAAMAAAVVRPAGG